MKKISILSLLFFSSFVAWGQNTVPPQPQPNAVVLGVQLLNPPVSVGGLTIQQFGAGGLTGISYYYWVLPHFMVGNGSMTGPTGGFNAPITLSSSSYFKISWQSAPGATGYDVLRTTTPVAPIGACNCAVAVNTSATSVNDQSNSLSSYTITTFDPNSLQLYMQNETQSSSVSHLILRQGPNGTLVCDLSVGCGTSGITGSGIVSHLTSWDSSASVTSAFAFVPGTPNIPGQQLVWNKSASALALQTEISYDARNYFPCDGSDQTVALTPLLGAIGATPSKLSLPNTGSCVFGNVVFPANVTLEFSAGGSIAPVTSPVSPGFGQFVQSHGTNNSTTLTGSCSVSLTGVAAGDAIIFFVQQYNGDSITRTAITPSDGGDIYVPIFATDTTHASRAYAWVGANVSAGSKTITSTISTPSTNQQNFCMAMEVSGVGATPKAYFANGTGTGGTSLSSGSSSIPAGTFLGAFGGQPYQNETCTVAAGYTQPASDGGSLTGQTNTGSPGGPGESLCSEYLNSSAGGSTSAGFTVNNTMTRSDSSPGFWTMNLIGLAPGSSTITILGQIINPDLHQIFFNALGGSQGAIDFTGGTALGPVYPEWWGASPQASASVNTPAIQAAIWGAFGCGPVLCRTNSSGLKGYNRPLYFSGFYNINGELQTYHMIGFHWFATGMNGGGLIQTAANSRIIDGQNVAYGDFTNMSWFSQASQDATHPLLNFAAGGQGVDLFDQFVTFNNNIFSGANVSAVGVQISPNGESNGNNFLFINPAFKSFSQACAQIGTSSANAFNALANEVVNGDIQGCPQWGLAAFGGQWIVDGTTTENGTITQTGEDFYCHTSQLPCVFKNVRSESFFLASGNFLSMDNDKTIFQGLTWNQSNLAGTAGGLNQLVTGDDTAGGDGAMYKVTGAGTWGGLNSTAATSGSATTIVCSGCTWTVNQWSGQRVAVIGGTGAGGYGVVSSNTATTITVPSWIFNIPYQLAGALPPPPDSTSTFVVEPNWGTQTTSGTVTFAQITGFAVGGGTDGSSTPAQHADIQNSQFIGFPINVAGSSVRNSVFSRRDFAIPATSQLSLNTILSRNFTGNVVALPSQGVLGPNGTPQTYQLSTSNNPYVGAGQHNLGTFPTVWSCSSARGGGAPCNDVWIGGHSDPAAGTSISRNVLEFGGILGPPTPFGQTNAAGLPTRLQEGLSTGAGVTHGIQFWLVNAFSGSGNTINPGVPAFEFGGATFSISGCSASSATGGGAVGQFTSGTTGTCTVTVTLGDSLTAQHGYSCWANDTTTPADKINQTGGGANTAILAGTTVSGDVINFGCLPY